MEETFWDWHIQVGKPVQLAISKYASCEWDAGDFEWSPPAEGEAVIPIMTDEAHLVTAALCKDISFAVSQSKTAMLVNLEVVDSGTLLFYQDEILGCFEEDGFKDDLDRFQRIVDDLLSDFDK